MPSNTPRGYPRALGSDNWRTYLKTNLAAGLDLIDADITTALGGGGVTLTGVQTLSNKTFSDAVIFSAGASQIIPGATSFAVRNNANNANNVLVSDAGAVTLRGDLTMAGQFVNSKTDSATTNSFNVDRTVWTFSAATIAGTQTGLNVELTYSGATSAVDLRATYSVVQATGAGTVSTLFAVYGRPTKSGTGVVSTAYAFYGVVQNGNATGAITNGYGLYVSTPSQTGPVTNATGVNVENQGTSTQVTNAVGIWIKAQSGAATVNLGLRNDATTDLYGLVTCLAGTSPPAGGVVSVALGSGATAPKLCMGSGVPSLGAAKGSLYLRTDGTSTSTRAYINSDGSTTWTALTTAA